MCPSCGARFKANSLWEWTGNFLLAAPITALIIFTLLDAIRWQIALVGIIVVLAVGVICYPYFTKYDLIKDRNKHEVGDS